MVRKIINIDEEKCNGCGICATACHEGAIDIIDGKAKLVRENYCDGLGDCLPNCPTGAISFVEREAPEYDAEAVKKSQEEKRNMEASTAPGRAVNRLAQWPCQIKLVPTVAPFFDGAKLLIAADCTAYAYANMHEDFMRGKTTIIGCPKLDNIDYSEKLTEIIRNNDIKEVTIVRMEVPCCGGLEMAAKIALQESGKFIPWQVVTISINGNILD
ncbi:MAG: 4Fe-4S binding protein [Firmicutes bacterium]|nr:4Fe-4S binding protein [Bacillota bacterium]